MRSWGRSLGSHPRQHPSARILVVVFNTGGRLLADRFLRSLLRWASLQRASFPLLLLLLAAPLPESFRTQAIVLLQNRSADATGLLFHLANVPFSRAGVVLTLPRVTIEIAQECSGIRSSLVLLIATLVMGHLLVRSWWSKAGLLLLFVPLMIAKNGLRIFALSMLGMYVDPSFLAGRLHRNGGILFFALAFACTWGVAEIFHLLESRRTVLLPRHAPTSAIAAKNSAYFSLPP